MVFRVNVNGVAEGRIGWLLGWSQRIVRLELLILILVITFGVRCRLEIICSVCRYSSYVKQKLDDPLLMLGACGWVSAIELHVCDNVYECEEER
jgi:phage shock protein PspC (stress-responsive transcriptional regulator)